MEMKFGTKALQFICIIGAFTSRGMLQPIQAFVLNSPPHTTTASRPAPSSLDLLPANITPEAAESFLNDSEALHLGVLPEHESLLQSVNSTSLSCPNATGSWWPGTEENLKSTCPWVLEKVRQKDDNLYPRYLMQAKCLCDISLGSDWYGCRPRRRYVTVFRLTGYRDGMATMKKEEKTISINVGCYRLPNRLNTAPRRGIPNYDTL